MDPAEVEQIKSRLIACRTMGHFVPATKYIETLSEDTKATKSIAIEICQLYLVQGQHRRAATACDAVGGSIFLNLDNDHDGDGEGGGGDHVTASIHDEEAVAFELLRAFVWIGRYSKLHTALKIARKVNATWKFQREEMPPHDERPKVSAQLGTKDLSEYRVSSHAHHYPGRNTKRTHP